MNALRSGLLVGSVLAATVTLHAARGAETATIEWTEQAVRFLSLRDPAVRYAVGGAVLMGVCCGVLGGFVLVRRMALIGDTLSHAVLPGVALGFLWNMSKDPVAIFVGAALAGLAGTGLVRAVTATTRLKEDAALGLVLASFFAGGACLVTMIQRLPTGAKSGIDKFLFGQAAAIGAEDLRLMAVVAALVLALVGLFYKELLVASFDRTFARTAGLPVRWIDHGLTLLLTFAVVIALQAVGAVLVSAMLITPAATARLLTDRMHWLLALAAGLGVGAGVLGAFVSFLGHSLPTGPFIVLAASTAFAGVFLFAPRTGVAVRRWRRSRLAARTARENTLKAIYHVGERRGAQGPVSVDELAAHGRTSVGEARAAAEKLVEHGLASLEGGRVRLLPGARRRAAEIVRNHRLWELYLTRSANIAADHVHRDAEQIEHVIGDDVVRELEARLAPDARDPHGRHIPTEDEIRAAGEPRGDERAPR